MPSPSNAAWIHVLPTPIAVLLDRAERAEGVEFRLLALCGATDALLHYLAVAALLQHTSTHTHHPKVLELLVSWLRRPLELEERWYLLRECLRPQGQAEHALFPSDFYYAANGRYTSVHNDLQKLIELHHLVTQPPGLPAKELESIAKRIQPSTRLYRVVAMLDKLWEWEIGSAIAPVGRQRIRAAIWRGPTPFEDWRDWNMSQEECCLIHPKEGVSVALPPFLMASRCPHHEEAEALPVLALFAPSEVDLYRGWMCDHPVQVHRGLERCRAFVDEYEELNEPVVLHAEPVVWDEHLSDRQRQIVEADSRQLLVVAGAGSGKTRVLTYRIAHLVRNLGVASDRLLAVTFTNKAAREMKERLHHLLGETVEIQDMWVGTFHAICLRILKEEIEHLGYHGTFAVVDRESQEMLIEETKADARYELRQKTRHQIAAIVEGLAPSPAQEALRNRQVRQALSLYRRKSHHELTVDDLIGMGIGRWGTEWGLQYLQRAQSLEPDYPQLDFLVECFETQMTFHGQATDIVEQISQFKDRLWEPERALAQASTTADRAIVQIYLAYQEKLRRNNLLDFGDLIMLTLKLFREFPDVLRKYQELFEHILVDEFQDINGAQERWLETMSANSHVFGVGDADQLIYEWRGADVETILRYGRQYQRMVLEENYRSGRRILAAANSLIEHNALRQEKALRPVLERDGRILLCPLADETTEASFVAEQIRLLTERESLNYSDIAILYRINAKSERFRQVLQQQSVPHRVLGGQRFYELPEIRHALNYLRVLHNPYDTVSLKQILRYQLQPDWVAHLEDFAREQGGGFSEALQRLDEVGQLDEFAQACVRQMLSQLRALRDDMEANGEALEIVWLLRNRIVQQCLLLPAELPPMSLSYLQLLSLEELFSIAQHFHESEQEKTIQAFLEHVALFSRQEDLQTGDTDAVTLMTMHSGKGLEFEAVFVVGCVDGLVPLLRRSRDMNEYTPEQLEQMELRQLEEERRLFYVSMTRAKRALYLTYPQIRQTTSSSAETTPSRFLDELPTHSVEHLEPEPPQS